MRPAEEASDGMDITLPKLSLAASVERNGEMAPLVRVEPTPPRATAPKKKMNAFAAFADDSDSDKDSD